MTTKQIDEAKERAGTKFEVAKQIRDLLDAARKTYGPTAWDDDDMESEVLSLVTDE